MSDNAVVRIRNIPMLDWAVYLTLTVFISMGFIFLDSMSEKILVVLSLSAFGLIHILGYRKAQSAIHFHIYFAIQTLIIMWLHVVFRTADLFGFLFFILVIQVMLALSARIAIRWILLFFVVESIGLFIRQGNDGIADILFNIPAYVLVSVFAYVFREAENSRRQNQKLLEELKATQTQLQELAVTEERTRLARELHDSLGHRLTVAVVQLEGAQRLIPIQPAQASGIIATMREELKDALADLRSTVSAMRSPLIEDQSLEEALQLLCTSFQQNTGLATHLIYSNNVPVLPKEHRLALYRAAQEGLTNVQRHANAKNAWVRVTVNNEGLSLIVEDDGSGFNKAEDNDGAGLLGLRERAEELGGRVQVNKRTGGGTLLAFNVPLPKKEINHE